MINASVKNYINVPAKVWSPVKGERRKKEKVRLQPIDWRLIVQKKVQQNEVVSSSLYLIRMGQDLHLISHIFSRLSVSVLGPKPAGKPGLEKTCTRRRGRASLVFSKRKHFLCVSFPWGFVTRLSWVGDGLGLQINWKAVRGATSIWPRWSAGRERDSRRPTGAKGIR